MMLFDTCDEAGHSSKGSQSCQHSGYGMLSRLPLRELHQSASPPEHAGQRPGDEVDIRSLQQLHQRAVQSTHSLQGSSEHVQNVSVGSAACVSK